LPNIDVGQLIHWFNYFLKIEMKLCIENSLLYVTILNLLNILLSENINLLILVK